LLVGADPRRNLPARNFQDVSASLVVMRFRGAKGLPDLWCVGSWLFEADVELLEADVDGTPFGRYRLIALIGEGGMGEVWRTHDTVTDRVVAVKVLPAKLSKDEDFQRRFRREAHAAARLETPHVVPIYDYGEIDGRLFVSMRLIKGHDLAAVLADGPLQPARAARIIGQVAEASHAAHEIGLIHRDIKPSNILLDDRDFAYLIDFGIARIAEDTRLTKTGSTIGTFAYIAPERLDGRGDEDARVDIYSLACVLYECLAGEPPFGGDTMARLVAAHLNTPPPRPSITRPEVPAQVDEVIATGMAKDPDQRYATTVELANAANEAITTPIGLPVQNVATPAAFAASPAAETMPAAEATAQQQAGDLNVDATQRANGPTLPPPLPGSLAADQRSRRRRRIALAGGAAVIAITITVVLIVVFTNGSERANRPPASPTSTAPANTGPFTGVYRADFGPSATNGKPSPGATPSTGQWAVRSTCLPPAAWQQRPRQAAQPCSRYSCSTTSADSGTQLAQPPRRRHHPASRALMTANSPTHTGRASHSNHGPTGH
jgi:serine/threonine protein kinase